MPSNHTLLVPTDFSQASEAAISCAIDLAKKLRASIVLMHVYQIPIYPYPTGSTSPGGDLAEHMRRTAAVALDAAASLLVRSGVPISSLLKLGTPWEEIVRGAREANVDMIVIGSRGLGHLPRALIGSTTERVVRYASVPVVTVHPPVAHVNPRPPRTRGQDADDPLDR